MCSTNTGQAPALVEAHCTRLQWAHQPGLQPQLVLRKRGAHVEEAQQRVLVLGQHVDGGCLGPGVAARVRAAPPAADGRWAQSYSPNAAQHLIYAQQPMCVHTLHHPTPPLTACALARAAQRRAAPHLCTTAHVCPTHSLRPCTGNSMPRSTSSSEYTSTGGKKPAANALALAAARCTCV